MSWRVVVVAGHAGNLRCVHASVFAHGHEVVGVMTNANNPFLAGLRDALAHRMELLLPHGRLDIAPLLRRVQADLVVCVGFPWRVPAEALAVPPLGWLNGHSSLLPQHRGPIPIAWAIRSGDRETGITFHRMNAELDAGPIVAQRAFALGDDVEPEEVHRRLSQATVAALSDALARLASGVLATPQPAGGTYESFFSDKDVWLDPSQRAIDLHRLVRGWRYAPTRGGVRGPLLEVDGKTMWVLRSSLQAVENAPRIECSDGPLWLVSVHAGDAFANSQTIGGGSTDIDQR